MLVEVLVEKEAREVEVTGMAEMVVAVTGVDAQAVEMVGVEMAVEACTTRWSTRAPRQSHSPCRSMKPPPMHHTGACLARGTRETPLRTGLRSC